PARWDATRAEHTLRHAGDQLLGLAAHRLRIASSVPLEHRELGLVERAFFVAPKAATDLMDAIEAGAEEPLHLVLGARDQEARVSRPTHLERAQMEVEARARHDEWRLDLQRSACLEERARLAQRCRAQAKVLDARPQARALHHFLTRSTYSPVRVSTFN